MTIRSKTGGEARARISRNFRGITVGKIHAAHDRMRRPMIACIFPVPIASRTTANGWLVRGYSEITTGGG